MINLEGQRVVVTGGDSLGGNRARPLRVAVVLNHALQADVISGRAHIDSCLAQKTVLQQVYQHSNFPGVGTC